MSSLVSVTARSRPAKTGHEIGKDERAARDMASPTILSSAVSIRLCGRSSAVTSTNLDRTTHNVRGSLPLEAPWDTSLGVVDDIHARSGRVGGLSRVGVKHRLPHNFGDTARRSSDVGP